MRYLRWLLLAVLVAAWPAQAFWQSRDSNYNASISGGVVTPTYSYNFATQGAIDAANMTYTGPSLRTIFDATGAITFAPNNLLTYSNTFSNATWTNTNLTVASGVSDPFGGTNASTLTATAANGSLQSVAIPQGGRNTVISVWLRRRTGTSVISLMLPNGSSYPTVTPTGTWQLFSEVSATTANAYLRVAIASSGDALDIYLGTLSAVTYETTPRPGDQVITTSAAYYGPAFDYSPTSIGTAIGLRTEEARTNLFLHANAPATQTITVASGQPYSIGFYGTGVLTLSGALTQVMTGSAYPARTTYAGTTSTTSLVVTVTTLGTMSYPQVELGAFPTSAIPTYASTITRAADQVQLTGGALAMCLSGAAGSVVINTPDGIASIAGTLLSENGVVELGETIANNATTAVGTNLTSSNTATWTGANDTGFSWSTTAGLIDLNATVTSDANSRAPAANFFLGSNAGTSAFWDSHFTSLACYNTYQANPQ